MGEIKLPTEAIGTFFVEEIVRVFDTASGGVGVNLAAIRRLHMGSTLLPEDVGNLISFPHSNFLASTYLQEWLHPNDDPDQRSPNAIHPQPSPNSNLHRRLFSATKQEYQQLNGHPVDKFKIAAVHKLGCLLAAMEQILYDASQQGVPIPSTLQPIKSLELYQKDWPLLCERSLPTVQELYKEAHQVLCQTSKPDDQLIAHLLNLDTSLFFAS